MEDDSTSRLMDNICTCFFSAPMIGGNAREWLKATEAIRQLKQLPAFLPSDPRLPKTVTGVPAKVTILNILVDTGSWLVGQERDAEAIPYLSRALELDPDDAGALREIGIAYNCIEKPQEALPYLQRLISLKPDSLEGYVCCGDSLLKLGPAYLSRAADVYRKARALAPDDSRVKKRWTVLNALGIR
jgi:tetratricopeptide (TPR) repeat protein